MSSAPATVRSNTNDGIAVVTPTFARDFAICRDLNDSVMRYTNFKHYLFVDRSDLALFRPLANDRTIVEAIEDIIPRSFFKVPFLKRHWMSTVSLPVKGWLIQQIVKISSANFVTEATIVNMDSDTLFVREVPVEIFRRDGRTRLYRLPEGVTDGMTHVRMHRNVARLLGVQHDPPPTNDYIGNVISWNRDTVLAMCRHIEKTTGKPWYVGFARGRMVSEYTAYGLYVDKVLRDSSKLAFHDERPHCLTYWGPEPLLEADVAAFVDRLEPADVAFSIEGYTRTDVRIVRSAVERVREKATRERDVSAAIPC